MPIRLNRRYQRTATTISSGGNRNPANADVGGSDGRERVNDLTAQACLDHANAQRNGADHDIVELVNWQEPCAAAAPVRNAAGSYFGYHPAICGASGHRAGRATGCADGEYTDLCIPQLLLTRRSGRCLCSVIGNISVRKTIVIGTKLALDGLRSGRPFEDRIQVEPVDLPRLFDHHDGNGLRKRWTEVTIQHVERRSH